MFHEEEGDEGAKTENVVAQEEDPAEVRRQGRGGRGRGEETGREGGREGHVLLERGTLQGVSLIFRMLSEGLHVHVHVCIALKCIHVQSYMYDMCFACPILLDMIMKSTKVLNPRRCIWYILCVYACITPGQWIIIYRCVYTHMYMYAIIHVHVRTFGCAIMD